MIIKHVQRYKKARSYKKLIEYLLSSKGSERVGNVNITHCQTQDEPLLAASEVTLTQKMNQRAVGDKTYHLVVSFPAGEVPKQSILDEIEHEICKSLKLETHQRVSVAHHDTNNFHFHIAINKIHPTRYTMQEPYLAYKTLARLAEKLEVQFDLKKTNHQTRNRTLKTTEMEHRRGVDSLIMQIKSHHLKSMLSCQSWIEVHQYLSGHGLQIKRSANGLVIVNSSHQVKASSVDRMLSKKKLEDKLGAFEESSFTPNENKKSNNSPPSEHDKLYTLYLEERRRLKNESYLETCSIKNDNVTLAFKTYRLKRHAIQLLNAKGLSGKLLRKLALRTLKKELQGAKFAHLKRLQYHGTTKLSFLEWLQTEALNGNVEATIRLRQRQDKKTGTSNQITSPIRTHQANVILGASLVSKTGIAVYRTTHYEIKEDGQSVSIIRGRSRVAVERALTLALRAYGPKLSLQGDEDFKQIAAKVAAEKYSLIQFTDAKLDALRKQYVANKLAHKNSHQHQNKTRTTPYNKPIIANKLRQQVKYEHRQHQQRRASKAFKRAAQQHVANIRRGVDERRQFIALLNKPNVSRIGCNPPPQSQNRLRNMSELGVVRIENTPEVLLSSHVHGDMVKQGAERNGGLRRDVHWTGRRAVTACEKYIEEREEKRNKGMNIKRHTLYIETMNDTYKYEALRNVDNEKLLLLEKNNVVYVKQINEDTYQKLHKLRRGILLKLEDGEIHIKGRVR